MRSNFSSSKNRKTLVKRSVGTTCAALLFGAIMACNQAWAADISGTVHAEDTGLPIPNSNVYLYQQNANGNFNYLSNTQPAVDGSFSFTNIPAGTYYLNIYTWNEGYLDEFYDDAIDWSSKTELLIGATDVVNLNPILLALAPFTIKDFSASGNIPAEGGTVILSGIAVNNTGAPLDIAYWVNFQLSNNNPLRMGNSEWGSWSYQLPGPATLPVGETPFQLAVVIPAEAPAEWISMILGIGTDIWTPIHEAYASVRKDGPVGIVSAFSSEERSPLSRPQQRIPQRVSATGKVLEWR